LKKNWILNPLSRYKIWVKNKIFNYF